MLKRLLCLLGFHKWVCKFNYGKFNPNEIIYCERCGAIIKYSGRSLGNEKKLLEDGSYTEDSM